MGFSPITSRRIAWTAALQLLLFGCGAGAVLAVRSGLVASAATLGLAALWIGASAAWQGRLRPLAPAPPAPDPGPAASEARLLASLLDQTPAPLVVRDAAGRLTARNRAARRLFGTDGPLLAPPDALVDAMGSGPAPHRTTVEVASGAGVRTYALSIAELQGAGGPLRMAALLDIEPELRAAEAAALRELLGVLSHEIMNGLTPVASLAGTARELLASGKPEAAAQASEALDVLARRADGLARFAEGYRTLARLPPPVRRPVSVAALVGEAAQLFGSRWRAEGVELRLEPPSPDIRIALDPDQMLQALANLLTNAAEAALPGAGHPCVTLTAGLAAGTGAVVFRVRDNGAGVAPEHREHIGSPFFSTKPQGTGVGLSLARQIARAHGGELRLLDTPAGEGALFELALTG
jgi:two-component system, NtrC family, nitrogen regulation sensor histidine kinase NtrY